MASWDRRPPAPAASRWRCARFRSCWTIIATMREVCPDAWLINFANPAGLLAEAAITAGGWTRTVGICDAPEGMRRVAAAIFGMSPDELYLDYFGLNHLGWVRAAFCQGQDLLPRFIAMLRAAGKMPGLPFDTDFVSALGMIPNEYLFYYYHSREAVGNLLRQDKTRGEQIADWNALLFDELRTLPRRGRSARHAACLSGLSGAARRELHGERDGPCARSGRPRPRDRSCAGGRGVRRHRPRPDRRADRRRPRGR